MKKFFILIIAVTIALTSTAQPVFAMAYPPPYDPYNLTANNIIFLDDPKLVAGCSAGAPLAPTTAKMDTAGLARIEALKPIYQQASAQTKVPWQVYAAIDYREDNNDPNKSMLGGEPLGTKAVDSGQIPYTKLESILMGDKILQGLAKDVYGVDVTQPLDADKLQKAFIVYNRGYSYKRAGTSPDLSPYVMNQYDSAHTNMIFPSIPGETLAGRKETGRLGALTVFAIINAGTATDEINTTINTGGCFGSGVGAKVDYSPIYPVMDAGTLPDSMLCVPRPSKPGFKLLKGPACDSFLAMDAAYKNAFGKQMPLIGGYRTAAEQIACGGTVQNPGGNNGACTTYKPKNDPPEHLWGTAIDFGEEIMKINSPEHKWLETNGPLFGWFWPNWASGGRGGNAGVVEAWHFAYYFVGHNPKSDKLESLK
jgi:hypothetical protein